MDKKILLPDLADMLADKAGITKKSAESFVRAFFATIEDNLLSDRYVKVKDFGTFKVVTVGERESVNVATGERIQISSHAKVSFTAEGTLRDLVNQPFAHFSNIDLEEGVTLPADEEQPEPEPAEEPETATEQTEQTCEPEPIAEPEPAIEPEPIAEPEPVVEPEPAAEPTEEPVVEPTAEPAVEPAPMETQAPSITPEPAATPATPTIVIQHEEAPINWWKVVCLGLIVLLLMTASYFVGYYHMLCPCTEHSQLPAVIKVEKPIPAVKPAEKPVEKPAEKPVEKPAVNPANYAQLPGGTYEIIGTKEVHELQTGESLRTLALKHYGNARMSDYIVVHNQIANPDVIALGAKIKIPELRKKAE